MWVGKVLLVVAAGILPALSGCGRDDISATPAAQKQVTRADRLVKVNDRLPSPGSGREYEAGVLAIDETRNGPPIGAVVAPRKRKIPGPAENTESKSNIPGT